MDWLLLAALVLGGPGAVAAASCRQHPPGGRAAGGPGDLRRHRRLGSLRAPLFSQRHRLTGRARLSGAHPEGRHPGGGQVGVCASAALPGSRPATGGLLPAGGGTGGPRRPTASSSMRIGPSRWTIPPPFVPSCCPPSTLSAVTCAPRRGAQPRRGGSLPGLRLPAAV